MYSLKQSLLATTVPKNPNNKEQVMRRVPLWIVGSVLLSGCLIAGSAVFGTATRGRAGRERCGIDRGYITPDAVLAVVAHPRRVLTAPEMEFLPLEIISAAGLKELGLDPVQLEEVLAIVVLKDIRQPPQAGLVLRFAEPLRTSGLLPELVRRTTRAGTERQGLSQGRRAGGSKPHAGGRADDPDRPR